MGFEGGHAKKYGFKGGPGQKILCKFGVTKKILSSFAATAVSVIVKSLSNEDGNGIANVTQKVNSRCFKLHRSYCNSSNWCFFFSRVEFYKGLYLSSVKEKETFFFLFQFSRFLLCFFFGGGRRWRGSSQLLWERRGGTRKIF